MWHNNTVNHMMNQCLSAILWKKPGYFPIRKHTLIYSTWLQSIRQRHTMTRNQLCILNSATKCEVKKLCTHQSGIHLLQVAANHTWLSSLPQKWTICHKLLHPVATQFWNSHFHLFRRLPMCCNSNKYVHRVKLHHMIIVHNIIWKRVCG
jgi:hypothetical protein